MKFICKFHRWLPNMRNGRDMENNYMFHDYHDLNDYGQDSENYG